MALSKALNEGRGRDPGDTWVHRNSGHDSSSPLNEGRGRDPGDTSRPRRSRPPRSPLNEGRGRDPGDTSNARAYIEGRLEDAQRRPGPRPRRHPFHALPAPTSSIAQRRPGPRPRRHEATRTSASATVAAQRRPGPRPRRHAGAVVPDRPHGLRSTKAGAETPATHAARTSLVGNTRPAQRRPGPRPRRHVSLFIHRVFSQPAQRRPGPRPRRHSRAWSEARSASTALNEGRGRDPGDTANRRGTPSWMQLGNRSADARPQF